NHLLDSWIIDVDVGRASGAQKNESIYASLPVVLLVMFNVSGRNQGRYQPGQWPKGHSDQRMGELACQRWSRRYEDVCWRCSDTSCPSRSESRISRADNIS